ncbi:MAG: germination protein YpeB [Oscillospiraceae bacterium]|nr:germination protein YpeB [Oscillospiraceae bacterium]
MITLTTRGLARIIAFPAAVIAALAIALSFSGAQTANTKRALENSYIRVIEELSHNLENIKNTLQKGMYSSSPSMMSELSARLHTEAAAAKTGISQLPVAELDLSATYKFLSQVGNYAKALSKRVADGEELTPDDRKNIESLYAFSITAAENMWRVEKQLQDGLLTFEKAEKIAHETERAGAEQPPRITDGFKEMDDAFDEYPMLIYDGPFSDHIMQKDPLMTQNKKIIDEQEALQSAIAATGNAALTFTGTETGRMDSYIFGHKNTTAAITKAGGFLSYMLSYRTVEAERITAAQATAAGRRYLEKLGFSQITETYHEIRDGVCIINFAGVQNGVTLYTDLIKTGVAMDTGEVISFDARGYLTNHHPNGRDFGKPALSADEAEAKLSPFLTAENVKLCLIPSDGMSERFCYEFKCRADSGEQLLVYINANTGAEEQILLLKINKNGILTV